MGRKKTQMWIIYRTEDKIFIITSTEYKIPPVLSMKGKLLLHPSAHTWLGLVLGRINGTVSFGRDKGTNKYDALDQNTFLLFSWKLREIGKTL
jgi:hypothetical protein